MARPAGPAAARETPRLADEVQPATPWRRAALAKLPWAFAGLILFVFSLEVAREGAASVVSLLERIDVAGPANSLGFGWLFAYVVLSGSPVAAIGVTLLSEGVLDAKEAYAVVAGSRLGASFIVLAAGFLYYVLGRRAPDGLSIGIIALLTTFTTQGPALAIGFAALHWGWFSGVSPGTPGGVLDVTDAVYGGPVDALDAALPGGMLFVVGVGLMLLAFAVFDRALPRLEGEAEGIQRTLHLLHRRPMMFLMGVIITLTTLSVSLSITVLVPLALKGYIRREHVIPYVLGANIATFADTLGASALLGGEAAFEVVFVQIVSIAAVSLFALTVIYGPYRFVILAVSSWSMASSRRLGFFLAAIVAVPAVLLVL